MRIKLLRIAMYIGLRRGQIKLSVKHSDKPIHQRIDLKHLGTSSSKNNQ